jgi:hypothetical protein
MREALLIGLAVVFVGLTVGRLLRRRAPRLAHVFHFGASALVRFLCVLALGWETAHALKHHDALHFGAAVVLCILALLTALMTALMLYVLISGSTRPPSTVNNSS